jgi:hypothetical protein
MILFFPHSLIRVGTRNCNPFFKNYLQYKNDKYHPRLGPMSLNPRDGSIARPLSSSKSNGIHPAS